MSRNSSRRMQTPERGSVKKMCKTHPQIEAAANSDLCKSCEHYEREGKRKAAAAAKP